MSKKATALILSVLAAVCLGAQNPSDLRIGEILVENPDGLTDDFGQRNGWIEIYNNSDGTVKFGGCYLTDDKSDLKKYHIPSNDARTTVKPRQSVVFFANGNAASGTFYTSFTLERGETVYLVSNDGKTIIDELVIPLDLQAGKSVMRVPGGIKGTELRTVSNAEPTPGGFNGDVDAKSKSEIMKEKDPAGVVLTVISVSIVFLSLFVLSVIFSRIGRFQNSGPRRKDSKSRKKKETGKGEVSPETAAAIAMALNQEFGGEVYAAIALALDRYLSDSIHDKESYVITIRPCADSQWRSKAQTLRRLPRK